MISVLGFRSFATPTTQRLNFLTKHKNTRLNLCNQETDVAAQIEVGVVGEVDGGALVAGGPVLHRQLVLNQGVGDLASQLSRVALVAVGTDQAEMLR